MIFDPAVFIRHGAILFIFEGPGHRSRFTSEEDVTKVVGAQGLLIIIIIIIIIIRKFITRTCSQALSMNWRRGSR